MIPQDEKQVPRHKSGEDGLRALAFDSQLDLVL